MDITKIPIIGKEIRDWREIKEKTHWQGLIEAWIGRWKEKPMRMIWITIKAGIIMFLIVQCAIFIDTDIKYCELHYENYIGETLLESYTTEMRMTTFLENGVEIYQGEVRAIYCTYKPIKAWIDRRNDIKKINEYVMQNANRRHGMIPEATYLNLSMEE